MYCAKMSTFIVVHDQADNISISTPQLTNTIFSVFKLKYSKYEYILTNVGYHPYLTHLHYTYNFFSGFIQNFR